MADLRLERIYNKQQAVFKKIAERPEDFPLAERDRVLDNLLTEYSAFVFENPDFVYGYILYGKLLRQVGDREAANVAFAKANQLDPQIAVVKQQIGNYLVEEGRPMLALPYFVAAVELEPEYALYHYQLGELLHQSRDVFIEEQEMPADVHSEQMLESLGNAARLDPGNRQFQMRYAEAFFDTLNPDWELALVHWNFLENSSSNPLERDIIRLQKARVLIAQGNSSEAETILISMNQPSLETARQELLESVQ
ncbi:tetratricopeptide repeat protein [Rubellicoccus peritrichatus]|uniref:Tetratricopeptide repeat protein n=1 Tax=Rubellicoccus peritrichatus TaxID=3080537 RepID=A0AAQ3QRG5_9BACT|nr:tetratricopeptide repeat protein [Puniceicoccus sp. CR14]WOO41303.1 tetratricopeptide repeat protein [Puniceicoccus sp. CR14]